MERARLLMTIDNHSSLHSVAATGTAVAETEPQDGMSQLRDQIEVLTQQVAALATQKSTNSWNHPGPVRCFNCNGLGHLQRNCPSPLTQSRPSQFGRGCFKCRKPGHIQKECLLRPTQLPQQQPEMKPRISSSQFGLHIRVYVRNTVGI